MKINNHEISIEKLYHDLNLESTFLKRRENGLLLNDRQVNILKRNQFDYNKYTNLSSLLFALSEYLNENADLEDPELEQTMKELEEIHYYQETRK